MIAKCDGCGIRKICQKVGDKLICLECSPIAKMYRKEPDPVHRNKDGKWYFWNETWPKEVGPYVTEEACRKGAELQATLQAKHRKVVPTSRELLEDLYGYILESGKIGVKESKVIRNIAHDIQLALFESNGSSEGKRITEGYRSTLV